MKGILGAALELQDFCERQNWRFCFIGGIAVPARLRRDGLAVSAIGRTGRGEARRGEPSGSDFLL